jgi:TolA-binding protein
MKKVIIASFFAISLAAGFVYANEATTNHSSHSNTTNSERMHSQGMMGGHGMMGATDQQNGSYGCPGVSTANGHMQNVENQKFMDDTVSLRKQMHSLRFDYMEAHRNPATSKEDLNALQQQMSELHGKISSFSSQTELGNN